MSSTDFLTIIRERWRVVLAAALVGLLVAGVLALVTPRQYTSSISLYISAQGTGENAQSAYQGSLLSEQRVKSYTELIQDRRIATDVVSRLRLPESSEDLQRQITASAEQDTVLIRATVADNDPTRAAIIANAVGDSFVALVGELELPVNQAGAPPVVARIVQPAVPVARATSPNVVLYLVFGLLLGLIAGLGGAVLRNAHDLAVRTSRDVEAPLDAPLLGVSFVVPDGADGVAPVRDDPGGVDAEAYRKLAANIQFLDADHPVRSFVVSSPSEGEGKTTTACNIALAASAAGMRVVVVDADLRKPSVASFFGIEARVGLTSVLSRQLEVYHALQPSGFPGLEILASGVLPPNPGALLGSVRMAEIIDELEQRFDRVVVDSAPILPAADTPLLAPSTDGVLVVSRHGMTSTTALEGVASALRGVRARVLGAIITFHPRTRTEQYGVQRTAYRSAMVTATPGQAAPRDLAGADGDATTTLRTPPPPRVVPMSSPSSGMGPHSAASGPQPAPPSDQHPIASDRSHPTPAPRSRHRTSAMRPRGQRPGGR